MKDEHRQHGTITRAYEDDMDGRCDTTWVGIDFGGSHQSFGGFVLQEHRKAWNEELCKTFGVSKLEELVGKHCWALRSFSGWNECICGLETVDGRRFVSQDFFAGRLNKPMKTRLEERRESIESSIAALTRRINDETRTLARLESDYVEWSTLPISPAPNTPTDK